ncbi:tail tape measure protein [Escherichia phage vB_EcoM_4HA13]|uniref:Tail tape measure protein n=1 Tax=Escherichia phage vB_EcoM_4HA13 TaxID=2601675 RepID=A0A7D0NI66_9CAUD|nr:virion structural protein [Escherichia phage vB_EcoM_4HA13]QEM43042.1 tail tape measure protein [Escherichia phage vB_EcoM_4HA13]
MANQKELMRLTAQELIGMGAQYGLTFHAGMKKSHMVQQLSASAASGWMDVNAGLTSGVPEDDGITSSFGGSSMISDAAHVAQMLSGAGFTETFHAAMNGPSHHVEAIHNYMQQLGVSSDDVWMHMPHANPNVPAGHFGMLNNYMRDTLQGHQDIMPEIAGHYSGDIMGEYATDKGGISASYEHLAHMYVDKSQYSSEHLYGADVSRVASRLAIGMGSKFSEVAFSAAQGAHVSYMSALPNLGDPSIVGGVSHPRAALNASGLPMGAIGSGINPEYSLAASLTGTPGWSPSSKEVYSNVSDTVKSLAGVYRGETGMEGRRHITSERDMIMDSASRYADISDVRSGYANLTRELTDDPHYSATNIRAIIDNNYDRMDAESMAAPSGVANPDLRLPTIAETGTAFTTDISEPTSWNSARARRESIAISNMDSIPWSDIENNSGPVKFHNLEQGSQEWLDFRKNYDITGSTVGGFLGNNAYTRPWAEMVDKIGLSRSKEPSAFQQRMFDAGHKTEDEARIRVAKQLGTDIQQTGAITNDNYPSFMYSPDGLIGDDAIWEHKNPERAGKFANLSAGDHPDYMDQVQFGMLVSGRSRALFSQTIGSETKSQWIEKDEGWYERNRNRLDSTLGRLDAGRAFVRENNDLPPDELIKGARAAMMGEGIWKDVSQKSNRGYSASAGTSADPFIATDTSAITPESMAMSVKTGILAAQEDNRQKAGAGLPSGNTDPFEMQRESADEAFDTMMRRAGYNNFGGGGGGGGRPPSNGGSFYDDFGRAGGALAAGVAGGSISSLSSGAMQALMATPMGRMIGMGIGAIQIGNEAAEGLNDFVGNALDAGLVNPNEYSSMSQGMEMLGLNSQQAGRLNQTTHSAYNTLLNGDPSGAIRIVQGTRGLINIGDIRATEGDPVALARIMRERGQERGWSQARIAGATQMAGLDGMARAFDRGEYSQSQAEQVVQAGRDSDYAQGTSELEMLQGERARALPGYNLPQAAVTYGGPIFGAASDAVLQARVAGGQVASGARSVYDFIMGEESGGRDYNADGSVVTSRTGAQGRMQVLNSTNRDPGFDVRPAQNDSLDERARVGRDYFDAMLKRYGDYDKAMAAYTDGPGTVDRAVQEHGTDWLNAVPAQAQNRVKAFHDWQQNGGQLTDGAGGFTRNGVSYGQTTVVQVNINAKVNGQSASATVSTPNGASASQQINVGNGAMQKR